ncbi:MAG: hypothetical protein JWM16_5112, partial [Verrucomicrobiales bacterium]|nr:hypothetical protein [Verrucomicrobiales bacterium]
MKLLCTSPVAAGESMPAKGVLSSLFSNLIVLVLLLRLFCQDGLAAITTNHGGGVFKSVQRIDPGTGIAAGTKAHVGDFILTRIRVSSQDGIYNGLTPIANGDTITITNILDIIHHPIPVGNVTNRLLFNPITLTQPFNPAAPGDTNTQVTVTNSYQVLAIDGNTLTDDAQAVYRDNHDSTNAGTGVAQFFTNTIPAQITILRPSICVTKSCINAIGENGLLTAIGTVQNCGNTTLFDVTVSNLVNGVFLPVLGPITLVSNETVTFTNTYLAPNPCAPTTDVFRAYGRDELFLWVTNSATATCSNLLTPGIVVTKVCGPAVGPGQPLVFSGCVSNSGNVALTNVVILNDRPVANTIVTTFARLEVGQSLCFTGSYPAPTNVCSVLDTLTARGTTICGVQVANSASAVCAVTNSPALLVTKFCPTAQTLPGSLLTFTGIVQNVGNVRLTNVVILNNRPTNNTSVTNFGFLDIGQSRTFTGSYLVPANWPDCSIADTLTARASDVCLLTTVVATNQASCSVRGGMLVMTCPSNITVQCLTDVPPPDPATVTVSSEAGGAAVTFLGQTTNTLGCVYTITRTYRATDACNNSATCNQTITVRDTIPPLLTCDLSLVLECGTAWTFVPPTGLDNCDGTNVVIQIASTVTNPVCGRTFTALRVWRGLDRCGNASTITQTVSVVDTIAPQLTCGSNQVVECGSAWNFAAPSAFDICDGTNIVLTIQGTVTNTATVGCPTNLVATRTWRATDQCGNFSTCSQTITVVDTTPPALTCSANVTIECGSPL